MPPGKHNQPLNPYSSAAGAYGTNAQKSAADPREMEARVLLKSAQYMADLQVIWDEKPKEALEDVLKYNRNIWLMFFDTALSGAESGRPGDLSNNIYNLAKYVFKRETDILLTPEKDKLNVLIKINRDIATGLLNGVKNDAGQSGGVLTEKTVGPDMQKPPSGGWDTSA
jgi:flagellar protein FlaF